VVYAPYDDAVIDRFLATDVWRDKAGAMAIQHPLSPPIDHIEGDYDTILGLSTRLLSRLLTAQGIPCHPADLPLPKTIRKLA
ncbi:Maf family protein, partial [Candidatus Saccharibacteria bacterium]|nr:Maf family protein [Candidatus Saccharibacteria bacterium]